MSDEAKKQKNCSYFLTKNFPKKSFFILLMDLKFQRLKKKKFLHPFDGPQVPTFKEPNLIKVIGA